MAQPGPDAAKTGKTGKTGNAAGTSPEASDDDSARRRRIPSPRAIAIAAVVLGTLDASLLRASGATWVRSALGGVLMAGFIVFGMRAIVRLRLRYRPEYDDPSTRDPAAPPPRGGWATRTGGQSILARAGKAINEIWRPRPPRTRR